MKRKAPHITQMTLEKHAFEGFNVRRQFRGYVFRKYVSASKAVYRERAKNTRINLAFEEARKVLAEIEAVIKNPKNWEDGEILLERPTRRLEKLGIKVLIAKSNAA